MALTTRISSNRSHGLMANTIELMVLVIGPWCVASFVRTGACLLHPMFKKSKSYLKIKIRSS